LDIRLEVVLLSLYCDKAVTRQGLLSEYTGIPPEEIEPIIEIPVTNGNRKMRDAMVEGKFFQSDSQDLRIYDEHQQ